jgi:hypothetical protein
MCDGRMVEIRVQRLIHAAVVHDFFAFLVLFSSPVRAIFGLAGKKAHEGPRYRRRFIHTSLAFIVGHDGV